MSYPSPFDYFGAGGYTENDPNNGLSYDSVNDKILVDNAPLPGPSRRWYTGNWARLTQTKYFPTSKRLDITLGAYCCIAGYCRNRLYLDDMVNPIWEKTSCTWSQLSYHLLENVFISKGSHTLRFEWYVTHDWGGASVYPDVPIGPYDYELSGNPIVVGDTILLVPNYGDKYDRACIKSWDLQVGDTPNLYPLKGGTKVAIVEAWEIGDKIIF